MAIKLVVISKVKYMIWIFFQPIQITDDYPFFKANPDSITDIFTFLDFKSS